MMSINKEYHPARQKRIGVVSWRDLHRPILKQALLYFDEIGIPLLFSGPSLPRSLEEQAVFDYLKQNSCFKEIPISKGEMLERSDRWDCLDVTIDANSREKYNYKIGVSALYGGELGLDEIHDFFGEMLKRIGTDVLCSSKEEILNAIPVFPSLKLVVNRLGKCEITSPCLGIIAKSFPIPNELVSLDEIIEFRQDEVLLRKRNALLTWQNKVIREGYTAAELADELAYLLNDYTEYMKLKKKIFTSGLIETVLKIPLEILENLIKLKPSKAIEAVFTFRKIKYDLMEAEFTAPGREVAYIADARRRFSS